MITGKIKNASEYYNFKNVLSLKNDFDLFVFDVFGVLWDGSRLYENAAAHLAALKQAGKRWLSFPTEPNGSKPWKRVSRPAVLEKRRSL